MFFKHSREIIFIRTYQKGNEKSVQTGQNSVIKKLHGFLFHLRIIWKKFEPSIDPLYIFKSSVKPRCFFFWYNQYLTTKFTITTVFPSSICFFCILMHLGFNNTKIVLFVLTFSFRFKFQLFSNSYNDRYVSIFSKVGTLCLSGTLNICHHSFE